MVEKKNTMVGKETLWVIDTTTVFGFYHKMDKVAGPKGPGSDV